MDDTSTTHTQDCNLIADAFERGAFFSNSEASVFAPITRSVQNIRSFSRITQKMVKSYDIASKLPVKDQKAGTPDAAANQGIKFKNVYISFPTKEAGSALQRAIKDCIPCLDRQTRLFSAFAVNISNMDFLGALKSAAKDQLSALTRISDLLSNIDIYGDYCQMVTFLDFMCVPDLQRMLAILAAQLLNIGAELGTLNSLLMKLIIPFFMPVLMTTISLMDQFTQLVLGFMDCIINSINENLRKININSIFITGSPVTSTSIDRPQFRSGLMMLSSELTNTQNMLANKIIFYTNQIRKLMNQWHVNDSSYLGQAEHKLITVRLIGFLAAMIKAKSKGNKLCENNQKPAVHELDNFYNTYISPTNSFDMRVDKDGLHISPKSEKKFTNTLSVPKSKLLDIPTGLFQPTKKTIPTCMTNTSKEDIEKVNNWMSQLK